MAIVPSGNRKFMETQNREISDSGICLGDSASIRSLIKSSQSVLDNNVRGDNVSVDDNPLGGNLDDLSMDTETAPMDEPDMMGESGESVEGSLRQYIFKLFEGLGVPPRLLNKTSDKIFKSTEDLNNGTVNGFYLIPTYTPNSKIDENKAKSIAKDIGTKFGLQQKLENSGSNYKVTFNSGIIEEEEKSGTSFDDLGGSKGNTDTRTAQTVNEMLKLSRVKALNKLVENK